MTNRILKILVLITIFSAAPVLAQSSKDAYLDIKKKTFKKEFKYLAMAPVIASSAIGMPDAMKQIVIDEVIKKFGRKKIKLLPSSDVMALYNQFAGLYPDGVQDRNRAAVEEHTNRELFFRYPVDGLLTVQILAMAAPFADDKAVWGGTSQKIKHRGDGFFGAIAGTNYGGHVGASAVRVVISDRTGKPVYNWMGGIEVLMQRNGKKLEPLPAEKLWQKKKRVVNAIKYALKPI